MVVVSRGSPGTVAAKLRGPALVHDPLVEGVSAQTAV